MRDLNNPIDNACAIAKDLETHYDFKTEVVPNPTLDEIETKLYDYNNKFASGAYPSDGQLLIFFSGHGIEENKNGYFCAADTDPNRIYRTALGYSYWRNFINSIDCKHILVAVDACYSGWFDPSWTHMNGGGSSLGKRPGELSQSEKLLAQHELYTTRWFFTSATNVESPDESNFAYHFREGLKTFGGKDGILTSSELWAKVDMAFPKPHQGKFGKNEPESSFLFLLKNPLEHSFFDATSNSQMEKDLNAWRTAKQRHTIAAYRQYLQDFSNGEFKGLAYQRIDQLQNEVIVRKEELTWEIAKEKNTADSYRAYLEEYPSGKYAVLARKKKAEREQPIDCSFCPEMVFIKGGSFDMGSNKYDDEKPIHRVTINDFYMGKYEVTNEEFVAFLNEKGNQTEGGVEWVNLSGSYGGEKCRIQKEGQRFIVEKGYEKHPIFYVSWYGARAYTKWLSEKTGKNYRLPSEAEWEYAAGGGSSGRTEWAGTSDVEVLGKYANFCDKKCNESWKDSNQDDGYAYASPVGSFRQNSIGLFDMSGNVWEWCEDGYYENYNEAPSNGKAWYADEKDEKRRVCRGGSWNYYSADCRVAHRLGDSPNFRYYILGFRVAQG